MTALSVVIPAYNEESRLEGTLGQVVSYLTAQPYEWEIVLVDDGSKDGTGRVAQRLERQTPRIRGIRHPRNQGKGAAVRTGLSIAQGELILLYDADGATPIEEVKRFLPHAGGGIDLVLGSRRLPESKVLRPQSWARRRMSDAYQMLARFLLGLQVVDVTCGFKLLSHRAVMVLVPRMRVNGWSFDAEMLTIARLHHLALRELPIRWFDQSRSKVRLRRDAWGSFRELLLIWWKMIRGGYR